MPIARRISLPAPLPKISGSTPAQNAIEVIRMGRRRSRQAWMIASSRCLAALLEILRELDDQDRVLARQADQHDQRHLGEDVEVARLAERREVRQPHAEQRREHAHRHDQDDRHRQLPALVLGGEHEHDQQHRDQHHRRDDRHLAVSCRAA